MTNEHTALPWVVESNPTIPEGKQVAAFEASGEMAGNRHLQVIIRSHNLDADAELIVKAVNYHHRLRGALRNLVEYSECKNHYEDQARALLAELDNLENGS